MERILDKAGTVLMPIGKVSLLLFILIVSFNIYGCYRPPKEPYDILKNELKGKAVPVKVEYLVDIIQKGSSSEEQKAAVKLLAEIGKPSVKVLIERIKDPKTKNREDYLLALKLIGEPAAEEVINLLNTNDPILREDTIAVLLAIGKDSVPELIKSLRSDNKNVKPIIIDLLATIKDERAVEPLAKIFIDVKEDVKLRQQTLAALVSFGKPAVPYLAQALHSEDEETREAASLAIESIGRGR